MNAAQPPDEVAAVRTSARRGRPLGDAAWVDATAAALGLGHTLRGRGRPAKGARAGPGG